MSDDGRYKGEHVGWSELANVTIDESTGDIMVFAAGLKPADALYRSRDHGKSWATEKIVIRADKNGWQGTTYCCDPGITLSHGKHKGRLLIPSQVFVGSINKDGSRTYLNKAKAANTSPSATATRYTATTAAGHGRPAIPSRSSAPPSPAYRWHLLQRPYPQPPRQQIIGRSLDGGQELGQGRGGRRTVRRTAGRLRAILRHSTTATCSGPGRRDKRDDITVHVSFDKIVAIETRRQDRPREPHGRRPQGTRKHDLSAFQQRLDDPLQSPGCTSGQQKRVNTDAGLNRPNRIHHGGEGNAGTSRGLSPLGHCSLFTKSTLTQSRNRKIPF